MSAENINPVSVSVHADKAEAFFKSGYNCAQSVLLAFSDMIGKDEQDLAKIALPFGGGFGKQGEVCGAISGMLMALGLLTGTDEPSPQKRKECYATVRSLTDEAKKKHGSIICRELLGLAMKPTDISVTPGDASTYNRLPCVQYVRNAAEILENYLDSHCHC